MEFFKTIPKNVWIVLAVFVLLIAITSYTQGRLSVYKNIITK